MPPSVAPFGAWASPITAALAASGIVRLTGVALDGEDVYWNEGRPAEGGRNVVVRRRASGEVADVTPPPFNVRSRVHEYGGGAFAVRDGVLFFVNDGDQRIWRLDADGGLRPLTPDRAGRHADLVLDPVRPRLVCVREEPPPPGAARAEPRNTVVAISLSGGEAEVLAAGADFYSGLTFDAAGRRLAYLSWDHPRMPWHGTELWVAPLGADGRPGPAERVAGGPTESVAQPAFSPDGVLHFVSDRHNWWNIYRQGPQGPEPVWQGEGEFAPPLWTFGMSTYAWVDRSTIAAAYQGDGVWHLAVIDMDMDIDMGGDGALVPIRSPLTEIAHLRTAGGRAVFVGASPSEAPAIWQLRGGELSRLHSPSAPSVAPELVSQPRPLAFATGGGAIAHALHYPPTNPEWRAPDGERPPLIVMSHGGPTGATSTALSLALQFWTSRGFAVLDVNYRGSTGYGRAYREALDGQWGIADVEDCAAGARHLCEAGLADPARLAIRGSSAGGYTTLAALTFTDVFGAGASYYGIGDLAALARDTHKFESHYLDTLIGPYPDRSDLYRERSPLYHVDGLRCPVIFFQGLEDRVVPPAQAEGMVAALTAKGIEAPYLPFPGEQHGFRRAETVATALEAELAFYRRVFSLDPR